MGYKGNVGEVKIKISSLNQKDLFGIGEQYTQFCVVD